MAANAPPVANRAVRRAGLRRGRLGAGAEHDRRHPSRRRAALAHRPVRRRAAPTSGPTPPARCAPTVRPLRRCDPRWPAPSWPSFRVGRHRSGCEPCRRRARRTPRVRGMGCRRTTAPGHSTCRSLESSANRAQRSAASSISCSLPSVRWAIVSRKATTALQSRLSRPLGIASSRETIARSSPESSASSARPTAAGPAAST